MKKLLAVLLAVCLLGGMFVAQASAVNKAAYSTAGSISTLDEEEEGGESALDRFLDILDGIGTFFKWLAVIPSFVSGAITILSFTFIPIPFTFLLGLLIGGPQILMGFLMMWLYDL